MWKSTPSRPSIRTTLGWVLRSDSWAKRLWYTLTDYGRGYTTRKNPITPVRNRSPGQACNQPLHWATPDTRPSTCCLKNPHNWYNGCWRMEIPESSLKKTTEHQINATQKFAPALRSESSNIIWRQRSAEIHVEVRRGNKNLKCQFLHHREHTLL
jgi:hypothetical protein